MHIIPARWNHIGNHLVSKTGSLTPKSGDVDPLGWSPKGLHAAPRRQYPIDELPASGHAGVEAQWGFQKLQFSQWLSKWSFPENLGNCHRFSRERALTPTLQEHDVRASWSVMRSSKPCFGCANGSYTFMFEQTGQHFCNSANCSPSPSSSARLLLRVSQLQKQVIKGHCPHHSHHGSVLPNTPQTICQLLRRRDICHRTWSKDFHGPTPCRGIARLAGWVMNNILDHLIISLGNWNPLSGLSYQLLSGMIGWSSK